MRLRTVRLFILMLAAATFIGGSAPSGRSRQSRGDESTQSAGYTREVRLRKLHLVRPDLITYPMSLEVYC